MTDKERNIDREGEIPDWAPKWVKPKESRRKGIDRFTYGEPGDFPTEEEYRRTMSRRRFFDMVLSMVITVPGTAVALVGLMWLINKAEKEAELESLAEQGPKLRGLLLETLQSDRLDNLGLFTDLAQDYIIQMTQNSQEGLFFKDTELRNQARWEVTSYVFSTYYHYPTSTLLEYDEYKETGTGKIDQETIRSRSGAQQANMWVEAFFRAEAFIHGIDASQRDGVFTSRGLLFMDDFVPLQQHSPSFEIQP